MQCLEVLKKDSSYTGSFFFNSPDDVDIQRVGKTLPHISYLSFGCISQKSDYWEMTICILLYDVEFADSLLSIESPISEISEEKAVVALSDDHTEIQYERNLKKHYKVHAVYPKNCFGDTPHGSHRAYRGDGGSLF